MSGAIERDFEGRQALVTGAGAGIGRAIALRLAGAGASVACVDLDGEAASAVAGEIRAQGGAALAIEADVSDEAAVARAVARAADEQGGLDVLVNNAGIVIIKPFAETSLEDWDRTFAVNLRSLFLTCQAALPHLRASHRWPRFGTRCLTCPTRRRRAESSPSRATWPTSWARRGFA